MKVRDMRTGICAICGHKEVLCAEAIEFGARGKSRTKGVAYEGKDGMMGFQPDMNKALGALRSYTCRSCGYTQWFADNPAGVPADENMRTTIIRGK